MTATRTFAAPAALPGVIAIHAEAMWASTAAIPAQPPGDAAFVARIDALADLLGLGPGDGHGELTRCDVDDCNAWFWADEGATVHYESGTVLTVCAAHAVADDPGARVYPGAGLEAAWRDAQDAEMSHRIRTTGSPW